MPRNTSSNSRRTSGCCAPRTFVRKAGPHNSCSSSQPGRQAPAGRARRVQPATPYADRAPDPGRGLPTPAQGRDLPAFGPAVPRDRNPTTQRCLDCAAGRHADTRGYLPAAAHRQAARRRKLLLRARCRARGATHDHTDPAGAGRQARTRGARPVRHSRGGNERAPVAGGGHDPGPEGRGVPAIGAAGPRHRHAGTLRSLARDPTTHDHPAHRPTIAPRRSHVGRGPCRRGDQARGQCRRGSGLQCGQDSH